MSADAYRRLEEGAYVRGMSKGTWRRFVKIAITSGMTVTGIMMLGSAFVSRFVYQDPTFQNPFVMIACAVMALIVIGVGCTPAIADE